MGCRGLILYPQSPNISPVGTMVQGGSSCPGPTTLPWSCLGWVCEKVKRGTGPRFLQLPPFTYFLSWV